MMKNLGVIARVLIATSILTTTAFAQSFPMPDLGLSNSPRTPPRVLTDEEKMERGILQSKRCPEGGKIIAMVDGVGYAVPRRGTIFNMEDGRKVHSLYMEKPSFPCSRNILRGVRSVALPRLKFVKATAPYKVESGTYGMFKKDIDAAFKKGQVATLSTGIQKFVHWNKQWEIYILPSDKSPAMDGQPVAMECDIKKDMKPPRFDNCRVGYILPNGVYIRYVFLRQDYEQDNFIDADKDVRAKLNQMIEDAKAISIQE